ncbi:MAG: C4-dicarboxylate ABC transporter permease [Parvibaculum sp.]|jgi:TRAP-type mannitol/chloroaromatic compound transport system permease small subunit|nr:C4-dicarboxylate ABC transporter permease [Parvibaculum sp.]
MDSDRRAGIYRSTWLILTTLTKVADWIDAFSDRTGRIIAWAALLMVLIQFAVVMMRYVFGLSSVWMQESIFYLHGILFMLAAGYTLYCDGHVRVDIFYREASPRYKATIDLIGTILFLWPVGILVIYVSWPYVASSWRVLEGSRETSGIPAVFLLKTIIPVFAAFIILQGLSMAIRSILTLSGQAPTKDKNSSASEII